MEEMKDLEGTETTGTETTGTEASGVKGYAALTPEQKEIAKAKQVESMKNKWQDPIYQAKVSLGRHTKSVEKVTAEIEAIDAQIAEATEEATPGLKTQREALEKKLAVSAEKVAEAQAIVDAATPVVTADAANTEA